MYFFYFKAILTIVILNCFDWQTVSSYDSGDNFQGDCETLLKVFANHTGDFFRCAISNIRPIRMCTACAKHYTEVVADRDTINKHVNEANHTCKEEYIDIDRVQVVQLAFSYVTGLWDKGNCANCFDGKDRSNLTTQFFNAYDLTEGCFVLNENSTDVCTACLGPYNDLNALYATVRSHFGDDEICMDIVDSMNRTQNEWSSEKNCPTNKFILETTLIVSCVTVLLLPVFFYIAVWRMSRTLPAQVSDQKRLSARLAELLRSRASSTISHRRISQERPGTSS